MFQFGVQKPINILYGAPCLALIYIPSLPSPLCSRDEKLTTTSKGSSVLERNWRVSVSGSSTVRFGCGVLNCWYSRVVTWAAPASSSAASIQGFWKTGGEGGKHDQTVWV